MFGPLLGLYAVLVMFAAPVGRLGSPEHTPSARSTPFLRGVAPSRHGTVPRRDRSTLGCVSCSILLGGALEPATHGSLVRGILRREACLQVPFLSRDHDERHDGHRGKKREN